jgi:ketosteroid isomerase-like protein
MSQENVEVVRRCNSFWGEGDFVQASELFDPEVVIDFSQNVFNPDVYRGYDGLMRLVMAVHEMWDTFKVETDEVIDAGETVVAAVRLSGTGGRSGVATRMRGFQVWTLRDGRVLRMKGDYSNREQALEAAGLRE